MSVKSQPLFAVVGYEAPSIEYATIKTEGSSKRKAQDSESDADDTCLASTGRVHCCVKNRPWSVNIGGTIDFRHCKVACDLLLADSDKVVDRKDAIIFSIKPGKSGDVELKISVLSSQYEGALFKLRFESKGLICFSEPIKVVSKKSQLEKETTKKRTRTTQVATREAVLEMLEKMEKRHLQQEKTTSLILKELSALRQGKPKEVSHCPSPSQALDAALSVCSSLSESERMTVTQSLSPAKLSLLQELAGNVFPEPPPPGLNMSANGFSFNNPFFEMCNLKVEQQ